MSKSHDLAGRGADGRLPVRVAFVCAGNICRSPVAEVILRARLGSAGLSDLVTVSSAGTGGWHVGEDMDPRARRSLRRRGYDPDVHRARQFGRADFAAYDLVLALDRANLAGLRRLGADSGAAERLRLLREYDEAAWARGEHDVADPYYGDAAGFERVVDEVEEAVEGLVRHLADRLAERSGYG